ncbi:hypothetical protein M885DRAFT_521381 [Pelagophyceae sp. CCMP2097]|nr:hypothetical protein M885DRAFT_521381 [Pelagophyceae sp. CCMP2097]
MDGTWRPPLDDSLDVDGVPLGFKAAARDAALALGAIELYSSAGDTLDPEHARRFYALADDAYWARALAEQDVAADGGRHPRDHKRPQQPQLEPQHQPQRQEQHQPQWQEQSPPQSDSMTPSARAQQALLHRAWAQRRMCAADRKALRALHDRPALAAPRGTNDA